MDYRTKHLRKDLNNYLYKKYPNEFRDVLPIKYETDITSLLNSRHQEVRYMAMEILTPMDTTPYDKVYNAYNDTIRAKLLTETDELREVFNTLAAIDTTACIVGGSVRDILLGREDIKDYDLVSAKSYDELVKIFTECGYKVDEVGKKFLVLKVQIGNGKDIDIACFRKDNYKKLPKFVKKIQHNT